MRPVLGSRGAVRRGEATFDSAFGALTGIYPSGYLERLDAEDERR